MRSGFVTLSVSTIQRKVEKLKDSSLCQEDEV